MKKRMPGKGDYDFRNGVRGKYTDRARQGVGIVILPAHAAHFPDLSVNAARRRRIRRRSKRRPR